MPVGSRILGNNAFGTTLNNPLAAGDTTLNSGELPLLPEVPVGDHSVITLDPLRTNGTPEIIIVTAHGPGSTSATIQRGAYGTVARSHPVGSVWVHAPVIDDTVRVVTSSTRPSDPYDGQLIYETDTESFIGRVTGTWQGLIPAGVITAFGGAAAPVGWLLCDGAAVSRTTFADLFAALGVAYGAGDGSTTFNLPNLQDRVPVGVGATFPTRGATGGSATSTAIHNHGVLTHSAHSNNGTISAHSAHSNNGTISAHSNTGSDLHRHSVGGSFGNVIGFRTDAAANGHVSGGLERETYSNIDTYEHIHAGPAAHTGHGAHGDHSAHTGHGAHGDHSNHAAVNAGVANGNMPPFQVVNYIIKF